MYTAKNLAASGEVKAGPALLVGVVLVGGSATSTVTVYDNTAASGTILMKLTAVKDTSAVFCPCGPVVASKGLYGALTGTGASATVIYG